MSGCWTCSKRRSRGSGTLVGKQVRHFSGVSYVLTRVCRFRFNRQKNTPVPVRLRASRKKQVRWRQADVERLAWANSQPLTWVGATRHPAPASTLVHIVLSRRCSVPVSGGSIQQSVFPHQHRRRAHGVCTAVRRHTLRPSQTPGTASALSRQVSFGHTSPAGLTC